MKLDFGVPFTNLERTIIRVAVAVIFMLLILFFIFYEIRCSNLEYAAVNSNLYFDKHLNTSAVITKDVNIVLSNIIVSIRTTNDLLETVIERQNKTDMLLQNNIKRSQINENKLNQQHVQDLKNLERIYTEIGDIKKQLQSLQNRQSLN